MVITDSVDASDCASVDGRASVLVPFCLLAFAPLGRLDKTRLGRIAMLGGLRVITDSIDETVLESHSMNQVMEGS